MTVLESAELPLLRVLGPEVAEVFADLHREHGVDLRLGAQVAEIVVEDGRATGVRLADGTVVPADAVLVGSAPPPTSNWPRRPGSTVDNGILVDAALRSQRPRHLRGRATSPTPCIRCWAGTSGSSTGPTRSTSRPPPPPRCWASEAGYDELPYFFTDQYDLGMEYLGWSSRAVRPAWCSAATSAAREFIAFWLPDSRVLAGMNVNVWDVVDPIKALIRSGKEIDPDRLADQDVPLDQV